MNSNKLMEQAVALINQQKYKSIASLDGDDALKELLETRHSPLLASAIILQLQIDDLDLYEIYVYNDRQINEGTYEGAQPGTVAGWDTRWVIGTDEGIKSFPHFDKIITKNDNSTGHRMHAIVWR
ncbi:hypothetical protein KA005_14725 [bacterium]|nr:hypothetical protein [bacterium]